MDTAGSSSCRIQQFWLWAEIFGCNISHSGDWLLAMLISFCRLKLSDEALWLVVVLRLGSWGCVPHTCRCGSLVDAQRLHGLA